MKKRFLIVCAILCALTITGCKDNENKKGTLSAPQSVEVIRDNGRNLICFDEVTNAEYYNIYINDISVTIKATGTGTIQFDASDIITLPQTYKVKVKAVSNKFFDSEFTEAKQDFKVTHKLEAPVISIDGTTINWNKISNAEFYNVVIQSNTAEKFEPVRAVTNKFKIDNVLTDKGDFSFRVYACNNSGEYENSDLSNPVTYVCRQTLITPHNLKIEYTNDNDALLSFISSADVKNFMVNINGVNYKVDSNYIKADVYENVYTLSLASFARSQEIDVNNSTLLTTSVRAVANDGDIYTSSSEFSQTITWQLTDVLPAPQITMAVDNNLCKITIQSVDLPNLSSFAIYLNDRKYQTIPRTTKVFTLPYDEVKNAGLRVQAISNNNNCYPSNLSNVVYANNELNTLVSLTIDKEQSVNNILKWNRVNSASKYCIYVYNKINGYTHIIDDASVTSLDLYTICVPGQYSIQLIAMSDGWSQAEALINNYEVVVKLAVPTNVEIKRDTSKLYFDEVDGAYGYLLQKEYSDPQDTNKTIQENILEVFTQSPINLSRYIAEADGYTFKIKAIGSIGSYVENSEFSDAKAIENIITLTKPHIYTYIKGDKHYLKVEVENSDKNLIRGYKIWIDYTSFEVTDLENGEIDITNRLEGVGSHKIMVQLLAIDSSYVRDSNIATDTYECKKQLGVVTNIVVTHLDKESKYILTFDEQTLAAEYEVHIVRKLGDIYEIISVDEKPQIGIMDITKYVSGNGLYSVSVQAVAKKDSYYLDSAEGGNPYIFEKLATLSMAQNIVISKNFENDAIMLTWDKVDNSTQYIVEVYYNEGNSRILKQLIYVPQSNDLGVNIGSGKYEAFNKEGGYTINIKALGESGYEDSQTATQIYNHTMESANEFERNLVFMYGQEYSHKVENVETLKNLLWYHYLYNENVLDYNTLPYNLKIYCDISLDELAKQISQDVADIVAQQPTNAKKMNIISRALLEMYPELLDYSLVANSGYNDLICLNEEENIYIFRYDTTTDEFKQSTIDTTNKIYNVKVDYIEDAINKRYPSYSFAIDDNDTLNVSTTEQLFMALQYGKQPRFVGDSAKAEAVYNNARFILRQICGNNMTEYEKVLKIYDFLVKRVVLDDNIEQNSSALNMKDLYLEGVLYNYSNSTGLFYEYDNSGKEVSLINQFNNQTASSQGIAKAFVVLCSIEGITSIKVNGILDDVQHSWNKVFIDIPNDAIEDKQWFAIDIARAISKQISFIDTSNKQVSYQVASYKYLLVTDKALGATITNYHQPLGANANYSAKTEFDYYTRQSFSQKYIKDEFKYEINHNYVVSNGEDLQQAIMYLMLTAGDSNDRVMMEVDAKEYFASLTTNNIISKDSVGKNISSAYQYAYNLFGSQGKYQSNVYFTIIENRYLVLAIEPINYKG